VFPTQKTQDAIDLAFVNTYNHSRPTPTQVIKKNY
jgi:hypothetical protein